MVFPEIGLDMKLKLLEIGYDSPHSKRINQTEAAKYLKKIIKNGKGLFLFSEPTNVSLEVNPDTLVNTLNLYNKHIIIFNNEQLKSIIFGSTDNFSVNDKLNPIIKTDFSIKCYNKKEIEIFPYRDHGNDILEMIFHKEKIAYAKLKIFSDANILQNIFYLNGPMQFEENDLSYWSTLLNKLDTNYDRCIGVKSKYTDDFNTYWHQIKTNHSTIQMGTYKGKYVIDTNFSSDVLPNYTEKLFNGINTTDITMDGKPQITKPIGHQSLRSGKTLVCKFERGDGMEMLNYLNRLLYNS